MDKNLITVQGGNKMDKETAIKKTYKNRKELSEHDFQATVERLVWNIEDTSNKLRALKARLAELEYKEPEILGGISTPKK